MCDIEKLQCRERKKAEKHEISVKLISKVMLKLPSERSEWVSEIKRGWFVLLAFWVLGASHLVAGHYFGKGWAVVTAGVAAVIWFLSRPWRFGLLSDQVRRGISISGSIGLCGFIQRRNSLLEIMMLPPVYGGNPARQGA